MATDVLDEHRFTSQHSLYEPRRNRFLKEGKRRPTTSSTAALYDTASTSGVRSRRIRYATQTSAPPTNNSSQNRHSVSNDFLSLFRSLAMKPFKTSSMTNAITEGQANNIIGGNQINTKPPVSLLRYRPLSDTVIDETSYTQSTRQVEEFLKRMGWSAASATDEARLKWKIAMKFLIPVKFDVARAISLYGAHENNRKIENLDRIWISNPHLIREIQSNKFYTLPKLSNQPLTVYFTASQFTSTSSANSLSQQERELVALQALICQLDVATETMEVQESGLNFIYDMQNCSASQFDINLSKKILKLLQGSYPAMVTMYTPDQMRDVLLSQYGHSLDDIPITLGGLFDPSANGDNRYQICLSSVTNSQSICFPYYSLDYQPITTKSTSNILFFNTDHHHLHHQNQNQDTLLTLPTPSSSSTTKTTSPQPALVAIVALRRNHETTSHVRVRKRESSSSSDSEKRRRGSNESLIEEKSTTLNLLSYIPHEIPSE
ncbi:unnamed protein product [Adineta steineri]|uniref:CRAL-TRIO domain-containing protein n=1 Tax=Adineta steineri TaxID=433720 RepID=A0A814CDW9_9BILA|nr:unnamed protein product [Adineta steineri]